MFREELWPRRPCSWIFAVWFFSMSPVPSIMFAVVVLSAVIWSSTSFLVGKRLRHRNRRAQRADGGGAGPVHALDQFDIILFDQIEREIPLHRHGHLREQILCALANIE